MGDGRFIGSFSTKYRDFSRDDIEIVDLDPGPNVAQQMRLKLLCNASQVGQAIWEQFDNNVGDWAWKPGVPPYDVFDSGVLGQLLQPPVAMPLIVGAHHSFYTANWDHRLCFQISDNHPDTYFKYQPKDKRVDGTIITPDPILFRQLSLIQQIQTAVRAEHLLWPNTKARALSCGFLRILANVAVFSIRVFSVLLILFFISCTLYSGISFLHCTFTSFTVSLL